MAQNTYYYHQHQNGLDGLTLAKRDIPKPLRGEVLIKIHAVSLNYRDVAIAEGRYPAKVLPNLIPTSDAAGEVVEVGEGVSLWKKGDRVSPMCIQGWQGGPVPQSASSIFADHQGMLTEYTTFNATGLTRIPDHLSYEEAATLPCAALSAWNCVFEGPRLLPGSTVLILGTGGVSIFGLQLAKAAGARVIVTSSSDDKLKTAKELGADEVVNYATNPKWDEEVLRLTNGEGVDRVVEVGGAATILRSLNTTKAGGVVSIVGFLGSGDDAGLSMAILQKGAIVQGIHIGSRDMHVAMNNLITAAKIKPVIDRVFPFDQAREAFEYLKNQKFIGKIVIKM